MQKYKNSHFKTKHTKNNKKLTKIQNSCFLIVNTNRKLKK